MELYNIKFTQAEEGVISKINLDEGEYVAEGQVLCVIEGDNVEYVLKSPVNGKIHKKHVIGERQMIRKDAIIFEISTDVYQKLPLNIFALANREENTSYIPSETMKRMKESEEKKLEFIKKYGNKTYSPHNITPELLKDLIQYKCNFSIQTKDISMAVALVEGIIEECGYKCRVYTENRSSALAAAAIPGLGLLAGAAAAIGIAAHNLATYDPDFEIGKNFFDDKVNVTYKK